MPYDELMDDLDVRLRQSRPVDADVDADAFDADLLARVRSTPLASRSVARRPIVLPVVAGVTVVATAAVLFIGGPGGTGGPSSADAITQTLHWLDPPDGTILHARSVENDGDQTFTREFWQSADDSGLRREVFQGSQNFEIAGDETFYLPAANTIYDAPKGAADKPRAEGTPEGRRKQVEDTAGEDAAKAAKLRAEGKTPDETDGGVKPAPSSAEQRAKASGAAANGVGEANEPLPVGDPVVVKVRMLLQDDRMTVAGRELHEGVEAWIVRLRPVEGEPEWTLWVSAADGKPLELRDPGRDGRAAQVIRWSTYEVLPGTAANRAQLSLTAAHPDAQVVDDPAQVDAARNELWPPKG
jgi:hypothetical protein